MRKKLLIIAHRPSVNTALLADAVLKGAQHQEIDGVDVEVIEPLKADQSHVMAADGVILGTTENLGYMSGAMKDFFDRTFYDILEEKQGMPYALYVRAGHDGTGTIRAIDSIVTKGLRWKPVCEPVLCKGSWQDEFITQCEELGTLMAAGIEASIF